MLFTKIGWFVPKNQKKSEIHEFVIKKQYEQYAEDDNHPFQSNEISHSGVSFIGHDGSVLILQSSNNPYYENQSFKKQKEGIAEKSKSSKTNNYDWS